MILQGRSKLATSWFLWGANGGLGARRAVQSAAVVTLLACLGPASSAMLQTITTVAGGGSTLGDGGPANQAQLGSAVDVTVDSRGNLFIADRSRARVRKVNAAGVISTFAGTGTSGYNGDGIPAASASVTPTGLAVDTYDNLYISETTRIRKVSPSGTISTVVGNGIRGFAGDGGSALSASISNALDPEVDAQGNLYFIDSGNRRVRKVDARGIISTVAGNGSFAGEFQEGGLAVDMSAGIVGLGIALDGALLMVSDDQRVMRLGDDGRVSTVAGGGFFASDAMARNVVLPYATDVATDTRGNLYLSQGALVKMITQDGAIHAVAGTWDTRDGYGNMQSGYAGDGGVAVQAMLKDALGIAVMGDGHIFVADNGNARVRRITPVAQPETPAGMFALRAPVIRYSAATGATVVGDFNGDGLDDIASVAKPGLYDYQGWAGDAVCIALQTHGGFEDGSCINMPATAVPPRPSATFRGVGLAVADMDGDRVSDVLVGGPGGIGIVAGSRNRDFRARRFSNIWNQPADELAVTDVNGDGIPDVVAWTIEAPGSQSFGLGIYLGTRSGLAQSFRFIRLPFDLASLRAADVSGDGRADLLMGYEDAASGTAGAAVLRHDGLAGFLPVQLYPVAGSGRASVASGDFNGDRRKDLAVTRVGYQAGTLIHMFHQDAYGRLQPATPLDATLQPAALLAVDLDRDMLDDLLVLNVEHWSLGYYQNRYGRGLAPQVRYQAFPTDPVDTSTFAVGDLNNDGNLDVFKGSGDKLLFLFGTGRRDGIRVNGSQPRLPPAAGIGGAVPQSLIGSLSDNPIGGSGSHRSDISSARLDAGTRRNARSAFLGWRMRAVSMVRTLLARVSTWKERSEAWLGVQTRAAIPTPPVGLTRDALAPHSVGQTHSVAGMYGPLDRCARFR